MLVAGGGLYRGGFSGHGFAAGDGDGGGLHLFEKRDEAGEGLFASFLVAGDGVAGIYAGAHEAVSGSVIGDGFEALACGFHGFDSGGESGADAGVVPGVEAEDGCGDGRDVRRAGAVEDEGCGEVAAVSGEGEGFAAAPAEANGGDLAVAGGDLFGEVGYGVEVRGDGVGVEARDGFRDGVHAREGVGATTVGAEAGEEIGRDDDEAGRGQVVGHRFGPVGEAEDLVDEDDDGGLLLDFGVDDEGLDGAVAVFDGDIFAMAGRGFEAGLGPVLCTSGEREEQEDGAEEVEGCAAHGRSLVCEEFWDKRKFMRWLFRLFDSDGLCAEPILLRFVRMGSAA